MKQITKTILRAMPLLILLNGCVSTSNFYSGRTLEEGKIAITVGADDIALKSSDPSISVEKGKAFVPSLGSAIGLPWRFELGARWYPTHFIEVAARHQLNPRDWNVVDASLNLHYAVLFGGYSYVKYGATVSKNISEFEPYIHYAGYHFLGTTAAVFNDSFLAGAEEEFINKNQSLGFGIGLPIQSAKFFPEVNYQFFANDIHHGLWHFGIGLRVYTK